MKIIENVFSQGDGLIHVWEAGPSQKRTLLVVNEQLEMFCVLFVGMCVCVCFSVLLLPAPLELCAPCSSASQSKED